MPINSRREDAWLRLPSQFLIELENYHPSPEVARPEMGCLAFIVDAHFQRFQEPSAQERIAIRRP